MIIYDNGREYACTVSFRVSARKIGCNSEVMRKEFGDNRGNVIAGVHLARLTPRALSLPPPPSLARTRLHISLTRVQK